MAAKKNLTTAPLPGELQPIPWHGERRPPASDAEVLGTMRRLVRLVASRGRPELLATVPEELPAEDAQRQMTAHRLRPLGLARARTRAEIESLPGGLTAVIDLLLEAYGQAPPGTVVRFIYPDEVTESPAPQ